MKFVVEVEDFWLEEEDLNVSLTNLIKQEVVGQIYKECKEQVASLVEKNYKEETKKKLETRVQVLIENITDESRIKINPYDRSSFPSADNDNTISLKEYVEDIFNRQNISNNVAAKVNKIANDYAANLAVEFKNRYDALFASQLVNKMNQLGMLKEDVGKILLSE